MLSLFTDSEYKVALDDNHSNALASEFPDYALHVLRSTKAQVPGRKNYVLLHGKGSQREKKDASYSFPNFSVALSIRSWEPLNPNLLVTSKKLYLATI
ncbi:hypothetical protein QTO34_000613 [Cnephaeus nilssonii]|uniref:Uncharacterized protein n=1 Tax=Cnephaeus nilssonii TaxID=3371016 RepID=A0AA40LWR1_CNENI|nr:hypothetical protein QTO34_000613 [Eptesicus nilssonii]